MDGSFAMVRIAGAGVRKPSGPAYFALGVLASLQQEESQCYTRSRAHPDGRTNAARMGLPRLNENTIQGSK